MRLYLNSRLCLNLYAVGVCYEGQVCSISDHWFVKIWMLVHVTKLEQWLFLFYLICQQRGGSTQLEWREWEEDMVMMNHITCMLSTCITWTGWNTRSWQCLLQWPLSSALVRPFQSLLSYSSKRKQLLVENPAFWMQ